MTDKRRVSINVPMLARVEGEGALHLQIEDGRIEELRLQIYEPPRLFEKFLQGRHYTEVPDIVARICGICPVAYQMSAVQALEQIVAFTPNPWVRAMRRLMYCGEWIESHSLHIHLLAAPDYLGYDSAAAMARDYPDAVRRGLGLQLLGNDIIKLLGGRSVHPVGVRVGGFHHAPALAEVTALLTRLQNAVDDAAALITWVAGFDLPQQSQDFSTVAMRHSEEYPMNEGRLVSNAGLDIAVDGFSDHITEHQVPHSTALHALLQGQPYLVGPLARLNLNLDRVPESLAGILDSAGIKFPSHNMFHSMIARAAEIYLAITEAIAVLESYSYPDKPYSDVQMRAGSGYGCSEAPRGILWQHFQLDEQGLITRATIIPPTSQNQARIEADLHQSLQAFGLDNSDEALRLHGEKVIRNYDPCISCATHFLKIDVKR